MTDPYYTDDAVTLYHGDALDVLSQLDAGSVDCCVTSPPYYGLRDYGADCQIGLEPSPGKYIERLVAVFREVRRILADDGTFWLNLGDSYSAAGGHTDPGKTSTLAGRSVQDQQVGARKPADRTVKNLLGIPWRVALALQDDGWTLRNDIVWHKPNAMPESVADRLSNRWEHVFLFAKSRRYHFDLDAIREGRAWQHPPRETNKHAAQRGDPRYGGNARSMHATGEYQTGGKNPGDVWTIPTQPFAGAHFACMPVALADRCLKAGCKPGGTVLDPFSGSGTTCLAAARLGLRYTGIDINADYLDLSLRTRLAQPALTEETA